jgi:hypothetical protein
MPRGSVKRLKQIDRDEVRKLAAIGATLKMIGEHFGVSHDSIERHFRNELQEGRSSGQLRALGRVYQKGVVDGETRSLELFLINQCGWSGKPQINVNVAQFNGLPPQELRAHLSELHEAIRAEAMRGEAVPIEVELLRDGASANEKQNGQAAPRLTE